MFGQPSYLGRYTATLHDLLRDPHSRIASFCENFEQHIIHNISYVCTYWSSTQIYRG